MGVSAYPKSLIQPFRKDKLVIGAGWRAYFAPYNAALGSGVANTSLGPTNLDLTTGPFTVDKLTTAGFFDAGWIKDYKETPGTKIGQIRSGYRGAVRAQYKGQVDLQFEVKFREYGRVQYKLATGTNVINLLANTSAGGTTGPISASGSPAVDMTSYTASTKTLVVSSATGFSVGDMLVADIDYDTTTYGIVSDAGIPVFPSAVTNVDYIRQNSDYVARVVSISGNSIVLDQAFAGGGSGNPTGYTSPQSGSRVQKVLGWVAREGGTFISEWTCVLLLDTVDIAQICAYYPHVSIMQNRDAAATYTIENIGTTDLTGHELDAQFQCLAFDDPLDGETVVGYKAFYPATNTGVGY